MMRKKVEMMRVRRERDEEEQEDEEDKLIDGTNYLKVGNHWGLVVDGHTSDHVVALCVFGVIVGQLDNQV